MNDYKFSNEEGTQVLRDGVTIVSQGGKGWEEYLVWADGEGNVTDPYKDSDEYEQDALARLWAYYDLLIVENDGSLVISNQKTTKLNKALRKENKGTANPKDIKLLDDNDTLDDWYDDMERAAEDQGETWIEDPARTDQELIDFDPATDIVWPEYPLGGE